MHRMECFKKRHFQPGQVLALSRKNFPHISDIQCGSKGHFQKARVDVSGNLEEELHRNQGRKGDCDGEIASGT